MNDSFQWLVFFLWRLLFMPETPITIDDLKNAAISLGELKSSALDTDVTKTDADGKLVAAQNAVDVAAANQLSAHQAVTAQADALIELVHRFASQ